MDRKNNFYIIDNNSDKNLWCFYLYNGGLYYQNNKDTFKDDIKIIDDVKTYDLCIDNHQRIHILCVIHSGELVHLVFKDDQWYKNTLHTFPRDSNGIDEVNIITINDIIHIFYNFRFIAPNIKFYNYKSFIMHGYKTEYEWVQSYIGTFHKPNNPKYFIEFDSEQNLHYFYLSQNQKSASINTLVFNKKIMKWFEPKSIKLSILNTELLQVLIDTSNKIHFIFKDMNTEQVYHYSIDNNSSDKNNKYSLITSSKDTYDFKILEYNRKLCVSWISEDSISYILSHDLGKTWTDISKHPLSKLKELKYINLDREKTSPKTISSFGYLENNGVFILGINDIPKSHNNVVKADRTNNKLSNIVTLDTKVDEDITPTINDDNNLYLTLKENGSKSAPLDTRETEKKEQSLWKKITNYLTLKE